MNKIFFASFLIMIFINCRPGSKKAKCKAELVANEEASICGGSFYLNSVALENSETQDKKQDFINLILLDCLRLFEASQKCRDASSYQPTIY